MSKATGFAAQDASSPLAPFHFERRALRPDDVRLEIRYCGICHTDLHQARNDWKGTHYPCCPGHEIVGQVTEVGPSVRKFKVGDRAAIGCLVDSCGRCDQCAAGQEQFCRNGYTLTYNSRDPQTGEVTYGGYSDHIVARESFVLRVPDGLDLARAAPLLCAGITVYSPLRKYRAGPGTRLGVLGLGGLGHMAVKLGAAMGCEVTVITSSANKRADALQLGAHRVLLSNDNNAVAALGSSLDLIIDTVPVAHDVEPCLGLLDVDGALVVVGAIAPMPGYHSRSLLKNRRSISASPIGGIAETQEMLDFCAAKGVLPDCEMIALQDVNHAFERMERADVKYRFVIDMSAPGAA
jgi:uncharacterized zinc-type alcohol dehydrogenase-like protein